MTGRSWSATSDASSCGGAGSWHVDIPFPSYSESRRTTGSGFLVFSAPLTWHAANVEGLQKSCIATDCQSDSNAPAAQLDRTHPHRAEIDRRRGRASTRRHVLVRLDASCEYSSRVSYSYMPPTRDGARHPRWRPVDVASMEVRQRNVHSFVSPALQPYFLTSQADAPIHANSNGLRTLSPCADGSSFATCRPDQTIPVPWSGGCGSTGRAAVRAELMPRSNVPALQHGSPDTQPTSSCP